MPKNNSIIPSLAVDKKLGTFKVPRMAFVDPGVLEAERAEIFDKCWLYLGHGSELKKNGDFITRSVSNRNIIFNKDTSGRVNAFFNTCPHRGSTVCREKTGNSKSFQCFYHGWVFGTDGKLKSQPGQDCYAPGFNDRGDANLVSVPRLEQYRDFYFICFDKNTISLEDYLGNAKEYIDLVVDQTTAGMEIVGGTQEYSIRTNWKLLTENSIDGYHAATTHATYIDYLLNTAGSVIKVSLAGVGRDLGNGHSVIEYTAPWGRPIAQWIPAWGEEGKRETEAIYQRLIDQFGEERTKRMTVNNRNLLIFPNLIINDIMAITVRTYYPVAQNDLMVNAWALAPQEESSWARKYRLYNFLEFLGPGGFATPDDVEALEQCQRGFQNVREAQWSDVSKGMLKETPAMDDEIQMRAFWTQWQQRLAAR